MNVKQQQQTQSLCLTAVKIVAQQLLYRQFRLAIKERLKYIALTLTSALSNHLRNSLNFTPLALRSVNNLHAFGPSKAPMNVSDLLCILALRNINAVSCFVENVAFVYKICIQI